VDLQVDSPVGLAWIAVGGIAASWQVSRFRAALDSEQHEDRAGAEPGRWEEWKRMMSESPTAAGQTTRRRLQLQLFLGAAAWVAVFVLLAQVW
jgi:hypothetical protein